MDLAGAAMSTVSRTHFGVRVTRLQRGFRLTTNLCQPSARKSEDTMVKNNPTFMGAEHAEK